MLEEKDIKRILFWTAVIIIAMFVFWFFFSTFFVMTSPPAGIICKSDAPTKMLIKGYYLSENVAESAILLLNVTGGQGDIVIRGVEADAGNETGFDIANGKINGVAMAETGMDLQVRSGQEIRILPDYDIGIDSKLETGFNIEVKDATYKIIYDDSDLVRGETTVNCVGQLKSTYNPTLSNLFSVGIMTLICAIPLLIAAIITIAIIVIKTRLKKQKPNPKP